MNKKRPHEPMLVHGVHVFYRGEGHWMAHTMAESMDLINEFIWDNDVFFTDKDPLYVFADHYLIYELRKVDHVKYIDAHGVQHERRAIVMLDSKGNIKETFALTRQVKS
jgi:hypothetical protein